MTHPSHNEPAGKGSSRQLWLLLLLVVLILTLVLYDRGAAKQYSQKAYSSIVRVTQKVSSVAKNLYACGLQGCPTKTVAVTTTTVPAGSGKMTVTGPEAHVGPVATDAAFPASNESATGNTDTQTATLVPGTGSQDQTSSQVSEGSNLPYPAYPNYPAADSSSTSQGASGDVASAPGASSEAPPAATVAAGASPQPMPPIQAYLPPMASSVPPMPPMLEAAPENPRYPAFQQYPPTMTPPMMPPPAMAQQAGNPRPDRPGMDNAYGIDQLAQARWSAQTGNLRESVRTYLNYLASHPNDIDAYGELGNVYLKMGRYPEAAQNYYEAATRLIDTGHLNAVAAMMPVIETHEPMLASLLNKKMANAMGESQGYRR